MRPNALGVPGCAEKSSISLFITMPVPGRTTPEPNVVLTVAVQATHQPSGVGRGEVGRVFPEQIGVGVRRRRVALNIRHLVGVDSPGQFGCVFFRGQTLRHRGEVSVAQPMRAVGKGEPHGLGHVVDEAGRVGWH